MSLALTSNLTNNNIVNTSPTTFTITCTGASATANLTWYYSNSNGSGAFYGLVANRASITVASSQAYLGTTNGWYFPEANSAMAFKVVDSGAGDATAQIVITRTSSGGGGGTLTLSSSVGQISGTTSPTPTTFTVSAAGYSSAGYLVWYYSNDNNVTWNVLASGTSAVTLGSNASNAINGLWFPEANSAMGFKVIDNGTGQTASLTVYRNPGTSTANGFANVLDYGAVSGSDSTTAFKAAIVAATTAGGGTVYVPAGVYTISDTLVINDICLVGDGPGSIIVGSSSGLGASKPIFKLIAIVNLSKIAAYFDAKPASATTGQYVIFQCADAATQWYDLQRPSIIDSVVTGACGTAFYNPSTANVFSTTFSNLRVENVRYRGFDFLGAARTGNVYSNIYINTNNESGTSAAHDVIKGTCNCLFSLAGVESESSIHQLNLEHATVSAQAANFSGCYNVSISSMHLEEVFPSANNQAFIKVGSSNLKIDSFTMYGNYYPDNYDPTFTGLRIFQLDSCLNTYGANSNGSANLLYINTFYIGNFPVAQSPKIFKRGTSDGNFNVDIKSLSFSGDTTANTYWATFPHDATNLTVVTTSPLNKSP